MIGDLAGGAVGVRHLRAHHGQDPLRHRRTERIDDVDVPVGQHVPGDLRALDRSRQ